MTTTALNELQALGFGDYEARAYLALLKSGPLSGYQLAKASGIPRPNIYPVLARLEQRGAVNRVDTKGADRYAALPAEQMLQNTGRTFSAQLAKAQEAMREVDQAPVDDQVWNIDGYDQVLDRARGLIDAAQEQLLVSVWSTESVRLAADVAEAERRGVDVTTLCVQGCPEPCGGCTGRLHRYDIQETAEPRSLVVIRDGSELLVGQCYPGGEANGAVTRMPAFVGVATQFLRNTVAVAEIARSAGPRLPKLLDSSAREAIGRAGVKVSAASWLDRLTGLTARSKGGADVE